ncbi:hypothetical protein [Enterovibrio sp. 27052020O]|uniref:hypothetical protein n=1 Tax=Enterovibrio sp. 27052020O TaxID=3241166 RepID=UPI00388EAC8A
MTMNKDKGMATLAVVSGVLVMVALFAVSVASSGYGEIKKAQNLLIDAEQRAKAKAGLDCAIAVFEQLEPNQAALNDGSFESKLRNECAGSTGSQLSISGVGSPWSLSSFSGFAEYGFVIDSGGGTASAFKTSGSLILEGGNSWVPAKGAHVGKGGGLDIYECLAIVAGGDVIIDTGNSTATFESQLLETNLEKCKEGFSTTVGTNTRKKNDFEADILHSQPNMDLFKDKFQEKKSEWAKIKAKFDVSFSTKTTQIVDGSVLTVDIADQCGVLINEKRDAVEKSDGKLVTIWVDGDCNLSGIVSDSNKPVSIVVKDGVLAYNGALANFNGSIFQFNYERDNFLDSWLEFQVVMDSEGNPQLDGGGNPVTTVSCTSGKMATVCAEFKNADALGLDPESWRYLPFLFRGSFETKGSYIVDVANSTSKVFGAFKPGYDASTDENPEFPRQPKIVRGSIHDF